MEGESAGDSTAPSPSSSTGKVGDCSSSSDDSILHSAKRIGCLVLYYGIMIPLHVLAGPYEFWKFVSLDGRTRVLVSKYSVQLHGSIINSKAVEGNEGGNWYGCTYAYQVDGKTWARRKHRVKLPAYIPDDQPIPTALHAGQPIRLAMIPDRPSSAIPLEVLVRANRNDILDTLCIPQNSWLVCCSYAWWFPLSLTGALMTSLLPVEVARRLLLPVLLSMFVLWFFVLGPPLAYRRHALLLRQLVEGGEVVEAKAKAIEKSDSGLIVSSQETTTVDDNDLDTASLSLAA